MSAELTARCDHCDQEFVPVSRERWCPRCIALVRPAPVAGKRVEAIARTILNAGSPDRDTFSSRMEWRELTSRDIISADPLTGAAARMREALGAVGGATPELRATVNAAIAEYDAIMGGE